MSSGANAPGVIHKAPEPAAKSTGATKPDDRKKQLPPETAVMPPPQQQQPQQKQQQQQPQQQQPQQKQPQQQPQQQKVESNPATHSRPNSPHSPSPTPQKAEESKPAAPPPPSRPPHSPSPAPQKVEESKPAPPPPPRSPSPLPPPPPPIGVHFGPGGSEERLSQSSSRRGLSTDWKDQPRASAGVDMNRRKSSWGTFSRVVVVAIDASPSSKYAFEWYLNNVWIKDDLVVLAHIPEQPTLPPFTLKSGFGVPVVEWKSALDKMNTKMRKLEEDFEADCVQRKLKYKLRGEVFKSAGEGICVIADDEKADLIVIGSKGVNAVKRAVMGSVSDFVVRHAGIPCLVVRAKKLT